MTDEVLYCGVDIGSTWTKVVLADGLGRMRAKGLTRTGMSFENAAKVGLEQVLKEPGGTGRTIARIISTGYGRRNADFADAHRTEIICHATGAYHYFPQAATVIDIGGQDNKVIKMADDGTVEHFQMNRKCASGTGAFIEEIARRLDIGLEKLEALAEAATGDITLSSFCTVFSATEVLRLIREGEGPENIARGIFNSVVARVAEMGEIGDAVVLTGGVASAFPIVARLMEKKTGAVVMIPEDAQFVGALGAAILASRE